MTFPFLAEHLRVACHKDTWSTRSPITSLAYLRKHCRAKTRQDSGSSPIWEMRALYTRLTSFILTKASNTIVMLLKPESKAWNIVTSLLRVKQIKKQQDISIKFTDTLQTTRCMTHLTHWMRIKWVKNNSTKHICTHTQAHVHACTHIKSYTHTVLRWISLSDPPSLSLSLSHTHTLSHPLPPPPHPSHFSCTSLSPHL